MHHAARIEEIALMVEQGHMEPQAAKVSIDARKWIASRFHPRQFSEKLYDTKKSEEMSLAKMHLNLNYSSAANNKDCKYIYITDIIH